MNTQGESVSQDQMSDIHRVESIHEDKVTEEGKRKEKKNVLSIILVHDIITIKVMNPVRHSRNQSSSDDGSHWIEVPGW